MKQNKQILPPNFFFLYFIAALGLHFFFPLVQVVPFPVNLLGIILMVVGIILNAWADYLFHKHGTTVKPFERASALITEGPFRISRHPMYLGFVLGLLGWAMLLGSLSTFITPLAMFLTLNILFVSHEEKSLQETFGSRYEDYKRKVRKWL